MNTLLNSAGPWLYAITTLSWKGALLALIVGLAILIMRRRVSPAWRHGLWLLILIRLVTPDLVTSPVSMSRWMAVPAPSTAIALPLLVAPSVAPAEEAPVALLEEVAAPTAMPSPEPWTSWQWLTFVWMLGAGGVMGVMVVLHLRMSLRVRRDHAEPSAHALAALRAACALAGVKRMPALIITDAVRAPALFGIVRPVILLPREVAALCDPASLNLILLHELAHLQRRDLWAQVAASVIIALHWFNPAVWWVGRRLRAEAEMAADARALHYTDATEAHRMGEVLLGFANRAATGWMVWFAAATVLGISENKRDLRRRIEALMDVARGRRNWWLMGLAAFVALAVTGLTKAPAEETKKEPAAEAQKEPAKAGTTSVTGIVVDEHGKPVQGATCTLSLADGKDRFGRKAQTNAQGRFRFDDAPEATDMDLAVRHPAYVVPTPPFVRFSTRDHVNHRLTLIGATSWISGTITRKSDGKPIQGATVVVEPETTVRASFFSMFADRGAKTDAAGHYHVANRLTDDQKKNMLIISAPGMANSSVKFTSKEGEITVDRALEPALSVVGKIVDAQGQPVQGASLYLASRFFSVDSKLTKARDSEYYTAGTAYWTAYWTGDLATGADGAFAGKVLDERSDGELWLIAQHPALGFKHLRLKDMPADGIVKLQPWHVLEGRVIDGEGKGVSGTTVQATDFVSTRGDLEGPHFSLTNRLTSISDAQGHYTLNHLLPETSSCLVSVEGKVVSAGLMPFPAGGIQHFDLRLPPKEAQVPKEQLRKIIGHIIAPSGHPLVSADYETAVSISTQGLNHLQRVLPDGQGKFETQPLAPGEYNLRLTVNPKQYREHTPAVNGGRSARFTVEPDPQQLDYNAGTFTLEDADFVFAPGVAELAKQPKKTTPPAPAKRRTQLLAAPVADGTAFTAWSSSAGVGLSQEEAMAADGRLRGHSLVSSNDRFIIRATRADGSHHFSTTQIADANPDKALETPISFIPSVAVEGSIRGLPAGYAGDGWMVVGVAVDVTVKPGDIFKGNIPCLYWYAWTPVHADGRYRFASLPRGRLVLAGRGDGWATRDLLDFNAVYQSRQMDPGPVTKVDFDTNACVKQRVRLLLPDGSPAAGATIAFATVTRLEVNLAFERRGHDVQPEDVEAYNRYKDHPIPGHTATADAEGYATLANLPPPVPVCEVKWTDPKTQAPLVEKVTLVLSASDPLVVKLSEKGG